ncbi:MAG TPA: S8 family serine peptidase [Verrucomicrobiales bacterium]|nr:S8 family serine peptidase [Verrucomicrobiales bacterium]
MKTPTLLFSLPFLVSVLAAQAETKSDASRTSGRVGTSLVAESLSAKSLWNPPGPPASGTSVTATASTAAPVPEPDPPMPVLTAPAVSTENGEITRVRIRGKYRSVEVMTDQFHVRRKDGSQYVAKLGGKRELGEVEQEARSVEKLSGDRADIVAYVPGRPKTKQNKMLITRRVSVQLADGVRPSVFAKETGAIRAQRPSFAPDALVLTYSSASEAVLATERLRKMTGVLNAEVMVASVRKPEFLAGDHYFSGGGPGYSPVPQTDNVETYIRFLLSTSGYQWWANNRATPVGPVNSVAARVDLGDFPPVAYDPALPSVHGEQADIRLPVAWENLGFQDQPVTGRNKKMLIVDDGILRTHEDLRNAVDLNGQRHYNFFTDEFSPDPVDPTTDSHGTSLAGIAGARRVTADPANDNGIAGVAPLVIFHGSVALWEFLDDLDWAQAFALGSKLEDTDKDNDYLDEERSGILGFDICLNASSESGSGDGVDLFPESWLWKRSIRFGATKGRQTNGVIFVTSAGNGGDGHNDTNLNEIKNCIYQIPVGSCTELGRRVSRSNPGANVVCVAPSWGDELPPVLNWPGSPGGSFGSRPFQKDAPIGPDDLPFGWRRRTQGIVTIDSQTNDTYNFNFNGTSPSAAMVAGVVALMLEVNPNLSARDVKEILLRSGRVINDVRVNHNVTAVRPTQWRMARTGRPMHDVFGAGLIDANKAILIAKQWPYLPPNPLPARKQDVEAPDFGKTVASRNTETGGIYFPIISRQPIPTNLIPSPPGSREPFLPGFPVEVLVPSPPAGMRLEHIEVRVQFYHQRRGDLMIKLVAPGSSGWEAGREMESILYAPHRDDYTESRWHNTEEALRDPTDWTFTTVRHWGTVVPPNTVGNWKVVIQDMVSRNRTVPLPEVPARPNSPPPTALDVNDPIFVPVDNPTDSNAQLLAGVGITYHGTFGKKLGIDPPVVKSNRFRLAPSTELKKFQLVAEGFGVGTEGDRLFPVTNWDFFDPSLIVPLQPSHVPREFFEYYPPAMALDPEKPDELTPLDPPGGLDFWPNQPASPEWLPWLFPPPPESGPQGGLVSQPQWVVESADHTMLQIRDPKNNDPATNVIYARLNRLTGELAVIPTNRGRFHVSVFAESLLGMSQPKDLEITIAPPGYANWIGLFFPGADASVTAFDADPDGDGIMNGLEFAMRLDPSVPEAEPVPSVAVDGNEVVFTYFDDTIATDSLFYFAPETSTDMETWTEAAPTVIEEADFVRKMELRIPVADGERIFIRLKALQTQPAPPTEP